MFEDNMDKIFTYLLSNFLLFDDEVDETKMMTRMEQAHWYYIDFFSDKYPVLPKLNIGSFLSKMFNYWSIVNRKMLPYTKYEKIHKLLKSYKEYKNTIPRYGAICLNPEQTKTLIVKTWHKNIWNYPKGKINGNETDVECAAREFFEELGVDIKDKIDKNLYVQSFIHGRLVKLFIIHNVDVHTKFHIRARKEIDEYAWIPITDIPYQTDKPNKQNRHLWPLTHVEKNLRNYLKKTRDFKINII